MTPSEVRSDVHRLTVKLIELGLTNRQNYPKIAQLPEQVKEVGFDNDSALGIGLQNRPYNEIYEDYLKANCFNFEFLDGGLIQLHYRYVRNRLTKHRLAYFPSPHLEEYQNSPEIYETDHMYADVIAKQILPVPLRLDFDPENREDIHHPSCHFTLGQYENCRIPVLSPVSPSRFLKFVLQSFYNTGSREFANTFATKDFANHDCITAVEQAVVHLNWNRD
jgi:hypothetical protein